MRRINLAWLPKPSYLAVCGAAGCLLAAVLAEGFLLVTATPNTVQAGPHALCLLLDTSGSMQGNKLDEVKAAASRLVDRRNLNEDQLAIVQFNMQAQLVIGLTKDRVSLQSGIANLTAEGSTNFEDAMAKAEAALAGAPEPGAVLLFTDGQPTSGDKDAAVATATRLRTRGARLFAIATGDADNSYLARLTGNRKCIIPTSTGDFDAAFRQAERMIFGQLIESSASNLQGQYSFGRGLMRVIVWTVLLSIGTTTLLVVGQNRHMQKRLLTPRQAAFVVAGGAVAGVVAGTMGQLLYAGFSVVPFFDEIGRVIAWGVLGALLARAMVFIIPNLNIVWSWRGGAAGGLLGAVCFLLISGFLGGIGGRLVGATILGFAIGLMVGLVEVSCREAWLVVLYGAGESTQANLGEHVISVGSSVSDTVFVAGATEREYEFWLKGGRIYCRHAHQGDTSLQPGARIRIAAAEVVVCTPGSPDPRSYREGGQVSPTHAEGLAVASTKPTESMDGLRLVISEGRSFPLADRVVITATDIAPGAPEAGDAIIGRVEKHSNRPGILGLLNLSNSVWTVSNPEGRTIKVSSGIAVPLRAGLLFEFGNATGRVIASSPER